MKPLRIRFLSTAGICRKNWKAIFHSGNSVVSAVASRDAQKGRKFIDACQREFAFADAPRAFGSYEELIAAAERGVHAASTFNATKGLKNLAAH
jgi:predicted dehydrogenase